MASQASLASNNHFHDVHQSSDHGRIQTQLLNAPPSPPPTIRKFASILSPTSFNRRGPKTRLRRCSFTIQQPFHLAKRTRVTLFWVLVGLLGVFCWWMSGTIQDFKVLRHRANEMAKALLLPSLLDGMYFIPASDQHIRYVGRWLHTPNRLRIDSHFPGAYLEFAVHNCSSVYVSLHNSNQPEPTPKTDPETSDTIDVTRLTFRPLSETTRPLPPLSLLSQIDNGEHTYFWQGGKGLVAIAAASLEPSKDHIIRITAPGTDDEKYTGIQFEGIWLNDGGSLTYPQKSSGSPWVEIVPGVLSSLSDDKEQNSRQSLEIEKVEQARSGNAKLDASPSASLMPQKTIEIVSDLPRNTQEQTKNGSLARLKGWEDRIGEMFGADHVSIAVDGMCLISPCIGGIAQPASVKDVFFRSGPPDSSAFDRTWNFRSYIPDALVLVLGSSDGASFRRHTERYEKSMQDLQRDFEETYVKFVKTIRRAAYPLHPAAIHDYSSNGDGFVYNSAPATLPIFVVSPFSGEMRHSTQRIVEALQADGDKAVFWLDTSGWFSLADFDSDVDERVSKNNKLRLNSQGNHKAAVFMHAHLCHFLAKDQSGCPFLKHEAYTGKVYIPQDSEINRLMEESKVKKLKALFWPGNKE